MAFSKKTWKYGDIVDAKDLNRMEEGIALGITQSATAAVASTTKNDDGKYNDKSGSMGTITPEMLAYLHDFVSKFWPYERCDLYCAEEQYSGNCVHGGLYAPITSGRPTGIDDSGGFKECLAILDIPDNINNRAVQLGFSLKRNGYVWSRICKDKNNKLYEDWVQIAPVSAISASTVSQPDVIVATSDMGVKENGEYYVYVTAEMTTTEVVIETGYTVTITLPEVYNGWRMILNTLPCAGSDGIVFKDGKTGEQVTPSIYPVVGATYAMVYNDGWYMYRVDDITRVIQTT